MSRIYDPIRKKSNKGITSTASSETAESLPRKAIYKLVDLIAVLKAAVHTVRHHKLGWLRNDLLADGTLDGSKDALHQNNICRFPTKPSKYISERCRKYWGQSSTRFISCLDETKKVNSHSQRTSMCPKII
jgi:hypothetical protein